MLKKEIEHLMIHVHQKFWVIDADISTISAMQAASGQAAPQAAPKLFRVQRHHRARTDALPRQSIHTRRATQPRKEEHRQLHPEKPKRTAGRVRHRNLDFEMKLAGFCCVARQSVGLLSSRAPGRYGRNHRTLRSLQRPGSCRPERSR